MMGSPIRWLSMVVLPLLSVAFFLTMMRAGVPSDMPVGVVDDDRSSMSRELVRTVDAMQTSHVCAHYPDVASARRAMQRGEVYAFLHIPSGTASDLLAGRQPTIAVYYTLAYEVSGVMLHRDLLTVAMLANASVGAARLTAVGATERQVQAAIQPIAIDLHLLDNPWGSYNIYLSMALVPGVLMLFIFLTTVYSLGTELKRGTSRQLMHAAGDSSLAALAGKLLPQAAVWVAVVCAYLWCAFGLSAFPHHGGWLALVALAVATVASAMGFGTFVFGVMPSLRMSMSVCSLWGVLSFSMIGAAFPVPAMDGELQALSWLFPLRHYFVVYQSTIAAGHSLFASGVWPHAVALAVFALLPLTVTRRIGRVMQTYEYIP